MLDNIIHLSFLLTLVGKMGSLGQTLHMYVVPDVFDNRMKTKKKVGHVVAFSKSKKLSTS